MIRTKSTLTAQPQSNSFKPPSSSSSSDDEEYEKFKSMKVKRTSSKEVNDKEVKLMMLGDSNVGKSKLIMNYICGEVSLASNVKTLRKKPFLYLGNG